MQGLDRRSRQVSLSLALVCASLALSSCMTRPEVLPAPTVQVAAMPGFRMKSPWASLGAEGVHFRGWICRAEPLGHWAPRRVRVERLAVDGAVLASATGLVQGVPPRAGCGLYDVKTTWGPDDISAIRICQDTGAACPLGRVG